MTYSESLVERPLRYFWRRVAALIIDVLTFGLIAGLLITLLSMMLGVNLGVSPLIAGSVCIPAPETWPVVRQVDDAWPPLAGETRLRTMCHVRYLGVREYYTYQVTTTSVSRGLLSYYSQTSLGIEVDHDGNPIFRTPAPDFSWPITLFFMAIFNSQGGRTLGKKLLKLNVTRKPEGWLTLSRALLRELLKFPLVPAFLVMQIYASIAALMHPLEMSDLVAAVNSPNSLLLGTVLQVVLLIWWLGPLVFWRGQMWYDRLTDTWVVRK